MAETTGPFRTAIIDNFHVPAEDCDGAGPEFDRLDDAIAFCKSVVDQFLLSPELETRSAKEMIESFSAFGESPRVVGHPEIFSSWRYVEQRAAEIVSQRETRTTSNAVVVAG